MKSRGFITIATGSLKYYKLAAQLLRSYRIHGGSSAPFAIIFDQENSYTQEFDEVIKIEAPNKSYMDKLLLYLYSPYDETIFIDADSLVLSDISILWEDYADEDDVSCCGVTYPVNSNRGWFTYEGAGKYKKSIHCVIDLHGGIYYFRRTERCQEIFKTAIEIANDYKNYTFKSFSKPADEPVIALSMAIHQCHPCEKTARVLFVPSYRGKISVNCDGELFIRGKKKQIEILHFSTPNTDLFIYQYLVALQRNGKLSYIGRFRMYVSVFFKTMPSKCKAVLRHTIGAVLRKLLPAETVQKLKERVR